jgi:tetratricopeptide (TPR) repeat protein
MERVFVALAVGAVMLSGCSDPEKAAQKSIDSAVADWTGAQESLDPQKRLNSYKKAIEDVERVGEKYKKTDIGQAVAAGRSVGGASLSTMKSEYDRLAERASCYAKPTVECLTPFASSGNKYNAAQAGSAENALQQAVLLVCEQNFAKADAALENLKINKPVYASNLVQVALGAAQCDKPNEVKAAINAYMAAEPSAGANRVGALLGIVQTDQLRDAWPAVIAEIEREMAASGMADNQTAGVDLTLASRYAAIGDAETALAKFKRVTEELGYTVDINTRREVAAALVANGYPEEGLSLFDGLPIAESMRLITLHFATQEVGGRLGVIRPEGAASVNLPYDGDLTEFFAPVPAEVKKREGAVAGQIEAELDKFVVARQPTGEYLGMSGADAVYARLALIQQKLGDAGKANALVGKAEAARESMSRPGGFDPEAQNYAAEFEAVVAIGQGDADKAVALLGRITPVGNDPAGLVLRTLAQKGEAEKALTLAAQINRASGQTYEMLINELGKNGHVKKAEQVLNAFPGDATTKSAMAWALVEKAAQAGEMKDAEKIAETYSLLTVPAYKLRMTQLKADEAIKRKDRGKAEAAIREMFAMGDEFDKMAAAERSTAYYAQNAAAKAFEAGYVDLGIELYQAASNKDQRPFFQAFSENAKPSDFPKVLMTAHDNVRGEELGYVIDAAIRSLKDE